MKKLLCVLLSALVMALPMASFAQAESAPAAVQAESVTEGKLEQMIPVLDSFANAMGVEGEYAYDAQRPEFVWTQLYLMSVNWANQYTEITQTSDQIAVPAALMQQFAAASFHALQALPQIPAAQTDAQQDAALSVPVRYDAASDSYLMETSDAGENYTMIEGYALSAEGDLLVKFGLYGADEARLGGFTAQMTENLTQTPAAQVQFPYSVKNLWMETADDFTGLQMTPAAIRAQEAVPAPETTEEPTATEEPEPAEEPEVKPTQKPAEEEYAELKRGDKGDAVRRVQERLNELGYDCGKADGVFGSDTREALLYFQGDAGLRESGIATEATQRKLFASSAPEYRIYVQLKKGDSGIRVEKLQTTLRKLGYLARPVSGEFDGNTQSAVKRFQKQLKLKQDGIAGEKTLKALYKKNAPKCKGYITLKKGDSGIRVKEMQNQLRKLGFMTKKANSRYDNTTVKAVKAYLDAANLKGNGKTAEASVIKGMFSYVKPTDKPTEKPEVKPTEEPEVKPTEEPEVKPTEEPEVKPTEEPEVKPTEKPEVKPTEEPEVKPTEEPEVKPTEEPEVKPTEEPEVKPTEEPEVKPTEEPEVKPTEKPEEKPAQAISDEELNKFVELMKAQFPDASYDAAKSVKWLQKKLSIDQNGIYDAATKDAVKAYQKDNALKETGLVDQDTLNLLAK